MYPVVFCCRFVVKWFGAFWFLVLSFFVAQCFMFQGCFTGFGSLVIGLPQGLLKGMVYALFHGEQIQVGRKTAAHGMFSAKRWVKSGVLSEVLATRGVYDCVFF